MLFPPTYVYVNPFYAPDYSASLAGLDYSQPIAVPTASAAPLEGGGAEEAAAPAFPAEASQDFRAARAAFMSGDYAKARSELEAAIQLVPGDPTLREFLGLILFAQGKYKEASAAIYAALSAGPGMDWQTLSSLYPTVELFTKQLRELEAYERQHANSSEAPFLLGYLYLCMGYTDEAINQFNRFVKLTPKDPLIPQLIKAFSPPSTVKPQPAPP
jgi:tetratricopeptide (TPR) repeat protein